jgi:hypothetical protein
MSPFGRVKFGLRKVPANHVIRAAKRFVLVVVLVLVLEWRQGPRTGACGARSGYLDCPATPEEVRDWGSSVSCGPFEDENDDDIG